MFDYRRVGVNRYDFPVFKGWEIVDSPANLDQRATICPQGSCARFAWKRTACLRRGKAKDAVVEASLGEGHRASGDGYIKRYRL